MKKNLFWSMIMLMVMALPFFTACGGDDNEDNTNEPLILNNNNIAGHWKSVSIKYTNLTTGELISEIKELNEEDKENIEDFFLFSDGTYLQKICDKGINKDRWGLFKLSDNKIEFRYVYYDDMLKSQRSIDGYYFIENINSNEIYWNNCWKDKKTGYEYQLSYRMVRVSHQEDFNKEILDVNEKNVSGHWISVSITRTNITTGEKIESEFIESDTRMILDFILNENGKYIHKGDEKHYVAKGRKITFSHGSYIIEDLSRNEMYWIDSWTDNETGYDYEYRYRMVRIDSSKEEYMKE